VPEDGVTVVTDMDDTIKVTGILDHNEKIANTFLRSFKAVPGMPELYRSWKDALGPQIHFHVVSAGPWQFYEPLRRFTEEAGLPAFTWDMRSVDIGDMRVLSRAEQESEISMTISKNTRPHEALPEAPLRTNGHSGEKDQKCTRRLFRIYGSRGCGLHTQRA
jgi:phosphatidate phosphatase APP1